MVTADDLIDNLSSESDGWVSRYDYTDVKNVMIEFAKLHVKAALERAFKDVSKIDGIDRDLVLNAYLESNIK